MCYQHEESNQTGGEKAATFTIQKSGPAVYLDPLEATTWRASLQHVAAKSLIGELSGFLLRPFFHLLGVIESRTGRYKTRAPGVGHKPQRFPGDTETNLKFGTDRNPFHIPAKLTDQEFVLFVATVKTHLLAEKTGRDPDAYRLGGLGGVA